MDFLEYMGRKKAMITIAMVLGITSAALGFFMMPYFSIPLACLSLTFAFLAKGYESKLELRQTIAIAVSIIAIFISVATTSMVINAFVSNKEYRDDFIEYAETLYGDSYEEIYGESFSEQFERLFPERSE